MRRLITLFLTTLLFWNEGSRAQMRGTKSVFTPSPATNCEADSFCEHDSSYPMRQIQSVVQANLEKFSEFFGADVNIVPTMTMNRNSLGVDEQELCISSLALKFPKKAENVDGGWNYIVNDGRTFSQGIRVEMCANANKTCTFSENFPIGTKTYCQQVYTYRYMLAVNETGDVFKGAFRMPAYCKCTVIQDARDYLDVFYFP